MHNERAGGLGNDGAPGPHDVNPSRWGNGEFLGHAGLSLNPVSDRLSPGTTQYDISGR
jgi:hypothetical protein